MYGTLPLQGTLRGGQADFETRCQVSWVEEKLQPQLEHLVWQRLYSSNPSVAGPSKGDAAASSSQGFCQRQVSLQAIST